MKTLYMETTRIHAADTVTSIQRILGVYGCAAIMTEYENGEVKSMSFKIVFLDKEVPFRLPCRWEPIYYILLKRRKRVPDSMIDELKDQAKRVAWRQILRWIEAQLALVDTEMVKIQEVFLPYVQLNIEGQTLYEKIEKEQFKLIGQSK